MDTVDCPNCAAMRQEYYDLGVHDAAAWAEEIIANGVVVLSAKEVGDSIRTQIASNAGQRLLDLLAAYKEGWEAAEDERQGFSVARHNRVVCARARIAALEGK